jgi:hypothetical protein
MPQLKNQTFINNITDPRTGKQVKRIYHMKMSKLDRLVEPMVWEYFRDRGRTSIQEIYNKFKEKGLNKLKMIFFGDPIIYEVNITEPEDMNNEPYMDKITDPRTTKLVKSIYLLKIFKEPKVSKILVWEYFRNRNNMMIQEVYDKYKEEGLKQLRFTFFNDNNEYDVTI